MASKALTEREIKQEAMDDIMVLLEILHQLDDVDLLGKSVPLKMKIINRLEEEIDKI